jgi:Protein kinase domain
VVGDYRVEDVLGRGGMAVVYSARHVELNRQVALKVLGDGLSSSPEFAGRFQREGRLQASLEHPHAVTVYDAGESEHGLYLAMQLVPGATLAELVRGRELPLRRALVLLRQVADAIDSIHDAGLVHRDVKPQNVLVGAHDDAYLGDFGLMRGGETATMTAEGRLVGTIPYLAPELIRGREAEPGSDRYAFAATVFECLTGTVVFPRSSEAAMLAAQASEPPPAISSRRPGLPSALDGVFERALAKEPGARFATAGGLIDAVEAALDGIDDLPSPDPTIGRLEAATIAPGFRGEPIGRPRRRLLPWLALAALVGAGAALGIRALVADDGGGSTAAASVPPPLSGMQVLGSDLKHAGHTVDCVARPVTPSSTGCAIAQAQLPGHTLVVPQDGVIRRWTVRSARGELALAVLRPHSEGTSQVARSRNEFVENDGVFAFKTDLPVQRGDRLGLVALEGSGVGAQAGVNGATTDRWIPGIEGAVDPTHPPGTGFDDELLLRVDYLPGGEQRLPHQVTGAAAANLPAGKVEKFRSLSYANGPPAKLELVALRGRYVLDQFVRGHRTARIGVPGWRPGHGDVITFDAYAEEEGSGLGLYMEYVATNSARVQPHFYAAFPHELQYID